MSTNELFTNIKVFKRDAGKVRGNGSFIVAGAVEVQFTIVEGKNGLFASLPQEKYTDKDGNIKYAQKVRISDKDTFNGLQAAILKAYETAGSRQRSAKPAPKEEPDTTGDEVNSDGLPF